MLAKIFTAISLLMTTVFADCLFDNNWTIAFVGKTTNWAAIPFDGKYQPGTEHSLTHNKVRNITWRILNAG